MNVLVLAAIYGGPYRVLCSLAALGASIVVLGEPDSRGLSYSRFCRKFIATKHVFAEEARAQVIAEINELTREHRIGMVVAADNKCARFLITIRDALEAATFPLPDLQAFDRLNDKWQFLTTMKGLGARCPASRLVADRGELLREYRAGSIPLPSIVKPLTRSRSLGVMKLTAGDALEQIAKIDYEPILLQDFIAGPQVDATAYFKDGDLSGFAMCRRQRGTYYCYDEPGIFEQLKRLSQSLRCEGVMDFDLIAGESDHELYWLECNPLFDFNVELLLFAGINYAALGIEGLDAAPRRIEGLHVIRRYNALALAMLKPWTITRGDLAYLIHNCSDPIANIREVAGLEGKPGTLYAALRRFRGDRA